MIAADTISYLYDPAKAMERLEKYEKIWGGTPQERQKAQINAYRVAKGLAPTLPPVDAGSNAAEPAANAADAPPSGASQDTPTPAAPDTSVQEGAE